MVPQNEHKDLFSGVIRRSGRVTIWGILLLLLSFAGRSQFVPPGTNISGTNYYVSVTITTNNSPADGTTNDVMQVYVETRSATAPYTYTPVNNIQVSFSIQGTTTSTTDFTGNGQFNSVAFPAGAVVYGQASFYVTPATIDITVDGQTFPAEVFYYMTGPPLLNPPPGTQNPSFFTTVTNDAPDDGTDTNAVEVHLTDGVNNFPPNTPVTFTVTSSTPASSTAMLNTTTTSTITVPLGVNGSVDLPITDLTAGNVTIEASVVYNGVTYSFPVNQEQTVTFVSVVVNPNPPPGTTNPSYYITIIPTASDNGSDTAVVQVFLSDNGIPVAGNTLVYFTVTSTGTASTNAMLNGTTTSTISLPIGSITQTGNMLDLPITDVSAGSVTITASVMVGGVLTPISGSPQTVTFTTTAPSINQTTNPSYFITTTNNQAADGVSQDVVEVYLTDAGGSPVSNYPVTFTITSTGAPSTNALFDPPPSGTPTSTTVTVNTTNSSSSLGAGYIVLPLTDLSVGSVTITATFTVTVGGVTTTYTVPVNQTVNFVTGPPVTTNPSGPPVPPGGGGLSGGSGPGPSNPSNPSGPGGGFTYLTMTYNNVPADGVSTDTATAYITDAEGHPVSGVTVTFTFDVTSPANGALFQPGNVITITETTDANGFAAAPITDTIPGYVLVDASISPGGLINGSSAQAVFTQAPDVNNPQTQLIVIVYEALADGTSTTEVRAHVVDGSGNPVANEQVTFAIDSGTAQILTAQPVVTDANGDASIYLSSTTVGNVLVTATVGGKQIIYGSPARVYFAGINIYVPRVFTPNNDGTNDILKPILVGISTFQYFTVYNRWGNIIFTTTDANQGWDGTFKGVPQPVETYLWIAQGVDINGKTIVAKGMTSLVR